MSGQPETLAELDAAPGTQAPAQSRAESRPNPYVGPRAFQRGETLYGRDRETLALIDLLVAERIVLLHSPSGAGKTSLIQAALIPRCDHKRFRVLPIIRVNNPLPLDAEATTNRYIASVLASLENAETNGNQNAIATAELGKTQPDESAAPRSGLAQVEAYLPKDPSEFPLLIFDQFEEILTVDPANTAAKHEFFTQLGELLHAHRLWALFAMREDYFASLEPYRKWVPTQFDTAFRLDLLNASNARLAIQNPARKSGVTFTDAAADKLVNDLRLVQVQQPDGTMLEQQGPYVEPVQLQVVLYRLWQSLAPGATEIRDSDVAQVGNVDQALGDYYAASVQETANATGVSERAIRQWFSQRLITPQGIRGQVLQGKDESDGLANTAIRQLENAHLVRAESRRNATWFELAHDRLIEPIQNNNRVWFDTHLSPLQRQAEVWNNAGRRPEFLLIGPALAQAETWAAQNPRELTFVEKELLQESRAVRELQTAQAHLRRNRLIALVTSVTAAIVLLALLFAIYNLFQAQRLLAENEQQAKELAAANTTAIKNLQDAQRLLKVNEAQRIELEAANQVALENLEAANSAELAASAKAARADEEAAAAQLARKQVEQLNFSVSLASASLRNLETLAPHNLLLALESIRITKDANIPRTVADRRLLNELLTQTGGVTLGHAPEPMGWVRFSEDDHWLAATSGNDIWLWDGRDLAKPPFVLKGHTAIVNALSFSADNKTLATTGGDHTARLWDLTGTDPTKAEPKILPYDDAVNDVAFSDDGRWLAVAGSDGNAYLYDLRKPDLYANAIRLENSDPDVVLPVSRLAFSPDNHWLATATTESSGYYSADAQVRLWDLTSADPAASSASLVNSSDECYADTNLSILFSPNSQWLAVGRGESYCVVMWQLNALDKPFLIPNVNQWEGSLAFSPDSQSFAIPGGGFVRLFGLAAGAPSAKPDTVPGHRAGISAVAYSPDGRWLATGSSDSTAHLLDLRDPFADPIALRGHEGGVNALAFSHDGTRLVTASSDKTLRVWSVISPHAEPFLLLRPDDSTQVRIWDLTADPSPRITRVLPEEMGAAAATLFSADGKWLAVMSQQNYDHVSLWNLTTSEPVKYELKHQGRLWSAFAFSPDSRWIVTGGADDQLIRVWNLSKSDPSEDPRIFRTDFGPIRSLAFNADGSKMVSGHNNGIAIVWDMRLENPASRPLYLHNDSIGPFDVVRNVAISPNGRWVATASWDHNALIWDLDSADPNANPRVLSFTDRVQTVAFSPDNRWVAAGDWGLLAQLADLTHPDSAPFFLRGHQGRVFSIVFSPNNHWLVTGALDQSARLWDLSAADPSAEAITLDAPAAANAAFSTDGRYLALTITEIKSNPFSPDGHWFATADEEPVVYHMQMDELTALACRTAGRNLAPDEWAQTFGTEPFHKTCPALP